MEKKNTVDIWHGRCRRNINPLQRIKQIVMHHNLSLDLTTGRAAVCSFSVLFLKNPLIYQKKHQILEPFKQLGKFRSSKARSRFFKALLDTCSFKHYCNFCGDSFWDLLNHQLFKCKRTLKVRTKFLDKIRLYLRAKKLVMPITDKHLLITYALENNDVLCYFTKFLAQINY